MCHDTCEFYKPKAFKQFCEEDGRMATLSTALANNFLSPSVHSPSMFKDSHTGSETQYQSAGTTLSPPALKNGLLRKIMVSILSDIKLSSVLDMCQYPVIKNDW